MASIDSSEIKIERFENEIMDEKKFEEKINHRFCDQYDENIEDILLLEKDIFLNQIKEGVQLLLEDNYTDYCFSNEKVTKLISKNMEEIEKKYNHHYSIINKAWGSYNKMTKRRTNTENLLTGFRKHCLYTEEFASHNCSPIKEIGKSNSCHFICVYSADVKHETQFVICENCQKVYYSTYILTRCNKCNIEYYTSLLSPEENPDMLIATWEKYHCPQLVNEKMKCIKCKEYFYLNMKNGTLTCLNKNCGASFKPSRILWTCTVCKADFKSEVKPYNPLEVTYINKLIEQTILLKHKAHPTKLPCCKLNVFFTDFSHKKDCDGNLYESELNEKIIVVCDKCHAINFFERFIWTCPKCGKKFKDKSYNRNKSNNKNNSNHNSSYNSENQNNSDNNSNKEEKNKEKDKICSTPQAKISKYGRRRIKSQIDEDFNDFNLNESNNIIVNNDNNENNNSNNKEAKYNIIGRNEKNNFSRKYRRFGFNNTENNQSYLNEKDNDDNNNLNNNNQNEKIDNPKIIEKKSNPIQKSHTSFRNNNKEKMKKNNTNKGVFRRFAVDKNNENEDEKKDEQKDEKKEDEKDKNNDKKDDNLEIAISKNFQNYSPRLMWKKRRQLKENDNKKNILILYSGANEKENKTEQKEKEDNQNKEGKEELDRKKKIDEILNISGSKSSRFYRPAEKIEKESNKSKKQLSPQSDTQTKTTKSTHKGRRKFTEKNEESEKEEEKEKEEENDEQNESDLDQIFLKEIDNEDSEDEDSPPKTNNVVMSKIPGVTENLYNQINKKISSILERCKIPIINIEDYIFDNKLGEGGYAVIFSVYKVNDENCKEYAMKKIIARSLDEIDKFTKEFELVYSCVHPNIMKIYGIGISMLDQTTYSLYVLMEKSKRDWDADIKKRLKKKKSYSEKELINILRQLTDALLFMQQHLKISHRDIKPQNVLLFENGIYKIADFGEAKETKISKDVNTLRGTELYMSPALYSGLKNEMQDVAHDPYKSDVFSLGFCFLYATTLNFQLLYQVRNVSTSNQMNKVLKQQLKKKYSDNFITILSHMMEIDESKRYNFTQLLEAIDANYDKEGNLKNT